jgi:hypothetical protein
MPKKKPIDVTLHQALLLHGARQYIKRGKAWAEPITVTFTSREVTTLLRVLTVVRNSTPPNAVIQSAGDKLMEALMQYLDSDTP